VSGRAFNSHEAMIVSDGSNTPSDFVKSLSAQSLLAVPIGDGLEKVGVISLVSTEENFFSKRDVGRIQLLGALVAYVHARSKNPKSNTEAAAKLGRAFSAIRGELGLTQDELAYRGGLSVAAKKGAILAGRKGPPEWLRDGLDLDHSEPWILAWLPYGNRAMFRDCRKFPHHLRSASLSQEKSSLFYPPCGGPVAGRPGAPLCALQLHSSDR